MHQTKKAKVYLWLQNPFHWGLVWLGFGIIFWGGFIFLLMCGLLNKVIPDKNKRLELMELSSQIINGIFTFIVLCTTPIRTYLFLLILFNRPKEKFLQYFPWATERPRYVLVFLILTMNVNVWAQFAITTVMWGWSSSTRPFFIIISFLPIAIGSGFTAGVLENILMIKHRMRNRMVEEMELKVNQDQIF
eukprot:TRINITY_DN688_c0_g1_i1.p1 TRINITY_DN688_c0_g1~~TRINITY_DN688_c0_g1_i1.p1  ORF type:complete len:208 (-),score=23.36 TRINITY_DN688_c0_g1_i1:63-632(-)